MEKAEKPPAGPPMEGPPGAVVPPLPDGPPLPAFAAVAPSRPWTFTASGEFLLWMTQSEGVTRGLALAGPATVPVGIAAGDGGKAPIPGGRFTFGAYVDDSDIALSPDPSLHAYGGELRFMFVGERDTQFNGAAAATGLGQTAAAGSAKFSLWGIDVDGRCNVYNNAPGQWIRVDFLGGIRYMQFNAGLDVTRQTTFDATVPNFPAFAPFAGATVIQTATFRAYDHFIGGQAGLSGQFFAGPNVVVGTDARLAIGPGFKNISAEGTVFSTPDRSAALAGVRFPANAGTFSRTTFTYMPEVSVYGKVGLCHNLSAYGGYTLLYWSSLARAADQVEIGRAGPLTTASQAFTERGLLLHGFFAGLEWTF
jgi:hypothetical protein